MINLIQPYELPQYKCHKVVRAMKIGAVGPVEDGVAYLYGKSPVTVAVPEAFITRHNPKPGDYLVCYQPDNYLSVSPAKAFEAGYTPVVPKKTHMESEHKEWPKYHNDEEVFEKRVAPLVDQLHELCNELGLPMLIAVSFMNSKETHEIQLAHMFHGSRTPIPFALAGQILKS